MVKKIFFMIFVLMFIGITPHITFGAEPVEPKTVIYELHACKDDNFDMIFLCNPDWELETHDDVMLIVIADDPAVTMTVARQKTPLKFSEQMTDELLQNLGQYEKGFSKATVTIDGIEMIKIEGFTKNYPDIHLEDYYFLKNDYMYSVLFAVDPAAKSFEYKELFKRIVESIHFSS